MPGRAVRVALAALLLLVASCDAGEEEAEAEEEVEETVRRTPVQVAEVERGRFVDRLEVIGELEAGRTVMVGAEIPGRIIGLTVEEGDRIERGQALFRVDVSQQRAAVEPLRVQLRQVESEIERTQRLVDRGLATTANVDQLRAQQAALREQIAQLDVTQRQARTTAPITGIVVEKMAESGEYASPGTPLLRVVDHDRMKVRVGIPEGDIAHVREGMEVDVRIDALDRAFVGEVARIGVELDGRNRTFPIEILVDNEDRLLRSGMRSIVTITRRTVEDAVIIPRDAIVQGFDRMEVLLEEDGRAVQRTIRTGSGLGPFVVVTEGLEGGERLVIRGHRRLVQGEEVNVVEESRCCTERFESWQASREAQRNGAGQ